LDEGAEYNAPEVNIVKAKDIAFLTVVAVLLFVIIRLASKLQETDQRLELVSAQTDERLKLLSAQMDERLKLASTQMDAAASQIQSAMQQEAVSKIRVTVDGFGAAI
jgi:predicted Holliday junction resolvase-like endonuclease